MQERRVQKKKKSMKKEYDFSGGIKGKYSKKYLEGTNLVRLDSEIIKAFPSSKDVNKALKTIITARKGKKRASE